MTTRKNAVECQFALQVTDLKIVKIILRVLLIAVIAFFVGVPFVRMFMMGDTAAAKNYLWSDAAKASYAASPETYKVYEFSVSQNFTTDGYFFLLNTRYTESQSDGYSQLQTTVRLNDSTLRHIAEDLSLADTPTCEDLIFILTDDLGRHYEVSQSLYDRKTNLNYLRIVFEDVDMTDAEFLYLNCYYSGAFDREAALSVTGQDEDAIGSLTVYKRQNTSYEYKLKRSELPGD